jgi:hypothetical protein
MNIFKRRNSLPPANPTLPRDDAKRLRNLENKRVAVIAQLANPNLTDVHRPGVQRRLTSIEEEIASIKENLRWN